METHSLVQVGRSKQQAISICSSVSIGNLKIMKRTNGYFRYPELIISDCHHHSIFFFFYLPVSQEPSSLLKSRPSHLIYFAWLHIYCYFLSSPLATYTNAIGTCRCHLVDATGMMLAVIWPVVMTAVRTAQLQSWKHQGLVQLRHKYSWLRVRQKSTVLGEKINKK